MVKHRREGALAVILHADIAGSTRLVDKDEQLSHQRIQNTFQRFAGIISRYNGQVQEIRGDALLADFKRASEAVSASLAFQAEQKATIEALEDDIKPYVRVGIAMGEIVIADNTMTGAGVVLAQRLEQLAAPGEICIQRAAYETIPKRYPFQFEDLGEYQLKGFDQPVQAYGVSLARDSTVPQPEVRAEGIRKGIIALVTLGVISIGAITLWLISWDENETSATAEFAGLPLPDKPSIAVLPFQNLSGDEQQKYFVDGVTEDIITILSRFSELFVIAKRSSFKYRDNDTEIGQIGKELGVQYALEGSIRRSEDDLIVTVQLIDTATGTNVWTERYQEPLTDIFKVQDNILENIVSTVAGRIENMELRLADQKETDSLSAYDLVLRGYAQFPKWTRESFESARTYFHEAIELDPQYARAYAGIGFTHNIDFSRGWGEDPQTSLEKAKEMSLKAIELDDKDNRPRVVLGWAYINAGELDKGIAEIRKGVSLNPNDANVLARSGYALTYYGEFQQAIDQVKRAMRINPFHPSYYYDVLAWAQYFLNQYDEALKTLENVPEPNIAHLLTLAAASARFGDSEKARAYGEAILQKDPDFNLDKYRDSRPFKYPEHIDFHVESLRMAGLP